MSELPRIERYVWWCGDEECNCTQAVVELVTANPNYLGFVRRKRLWEGRFFSDYNALDYPDTPSPEEELKSAPPDEELLREQATICRCGHTLSQHENLPRSTSACAFCSCPLFRAKPERPPEKARKPL